MTTQYTADLLVLPYGQLDDTDWHTTLNAMIALIAEATVGYVAVAMGDANVTLTQTNGVSNQSRPRFIKTTGALTAARNVVVPSNPGWWMVWNACTGGFAVQVKTSGGTGVAVLPNTKVFVFCDGTETYYAQSQFEKGTDIASATTTNLANASGSFVHVTGTTTITGLGTAPAGTLRAVRFAGALTLTHNATSLILPGAANITTAANDTAIFVSEGSGNWRCLTYFRASGLGIINTTPTQQRFTAAGAATWNRPSGCRKIRIIATGGGGGGGGADESRSGAAGGGAGGTVIHWMDVTATSSLSLVIGAAGSAGSTSGGNGGAGGDTTVATTTIVATGGAGGEGCAGNAEAQGGLGGAPSAGDLQLVGGDGGSGGSVGSTPVPGGTGGASYWGGGGRGGSNATANRAGQAGRAYGSGGGGGASFNSTGAAGGAGCAGCIVIDEFY